ncbi:hypothetical protein MMC30_007257 [Trapelia coarctata]|nr:hypothetical protein [Trapelia coarctata]
MSETTSSSDVSPLPVYTLSLVSPLSTHISDFALSLIIPLVVYWATSLVFHWIDTQDLFSEYRIHTSTEEKARNTASRLEVLRGVVVVQIIQTALGVALGLLLGTEDGTGKDEHDIAVWTARLQIARQAIPYLLTAVGIDADGLGEKLSRSGLNVAALLVGGPDLAKSTGDGESGAELPTEREMTISRLIYWYGVPMIQFISAVSIADTWQYFGHRWEHTNRRWYKNVHHIHHTLYVPYAYGAAYTHPLEGLLLDALGMNHFAAHTGFWDRVMGTTWQDKDAAAKLYAKSANVARAQENTKRATRKFDTPSF